jgi:hypothetical protein
MPAHRRHRSLAEKQKAYRVRQAAARLAELEAKGLPALPRLPSMPGTARWKAMTQAALSLLETMLAEMETYRDERSEEWRDGEKGMAFDEAVDQVREAEGCVAAIC